MRKNHTELVCVLDRSGSMENIRQDAIGGFNAFLAGQRKVAGTAAVTLVLFDNEYEVVHAAVDLSVVQDLTAKTFVPRGSTALLDAVGRTINDVGARLAKMDEQDRPEKVMVCILTDGQENVSREFTTAKIKDMIEHQRTKYSWEFAFLAANQDAFATAGSLGINSSFTANFVATGAGTRQAYACLDSMAVGYRKGSGNW
jgi:uncharacterized protein YegL